MSSCSFDPLGGYTRYEAYLDLSLDIGKKAVSIRKALQHFTRGETLQGDNQYNCARCQCKVDAVKRMTLHTLPGYAVCHTVSPPLM